MASAEPRSDSCGCCAGTDVETPRRIDNLQGLSTIAYRTGTYARFRESLLARLSSSAYPTLKTLGTRDGDDFTIALCDALAATLDVLTFYQERIANEHYLRTATEERSVLAMARLIGYVPSPGVAASAHIAFSLQEAAGAAAQSAGSITIPIGTKVQSVPGQDEEAQTFETVAEATACVEWNAIAVQASEPWQPHYGDTDLYLEGVSTQLSPGDAILIVGVERLADGRNNNWDVRALDSVEPDTTNGRTRIAWTDPLGEVVPRVLPAALGVEVFAFRQRAALFGHNAPDPNVMGKGDSKLGELTKADPSDANRLVWKNYEIDASHIDLDATYGKITAGSWLALVSNEAGIGNDALPGYVELYRAQKVFQISRTGFGLSGKITRIKPDTTENLDASRYTIQKTLVLGQTEALSPSERRLLHPIYGDALALATRIDGLLPGQAVAFSGKRQRLAVASGVTGLGLVLDGGGTVALEEGDSLSLLEAPAQVTGSTAVYLDPEAFASRLGNGAARLRLNVMDRDGQTGTLTAQGDQIVLAASVKGDEEVAEIALLAGESDAVLHSRDRTSLRLSSSLRYCYERASVRINANVARATHGETMDETLGGGDASQTDQNFTLRQSPLTYVSASTPSGRASTAEVRVNDVLWLETPSLYGRQPSERVYAVEVDDAAQAVIRFGDGVEGARLPSGQNNVRTTYRKGLGGGGNVSAGKLTTLLSRPLGVMGATNPEPATGGEDSEPLDRARENAPVTVLTLDRAVSTKDYADFARAFAGIAKAHALWIPAGSGRGLFITVAGIDGADVPTESDTYINLLGALRAYGDPLMPIRLVTGRSSTFRARLAVKVAPEYEVDDVLASVEDSLRTEFGFDSREFGQGVSVDEVMAVVHAVSGVEALQVTELYDTSSGAPHSLTLRLAAALPVASFGEIPEAAELLTLADDPLELEELP